MKQIYNFETKNPPVLNETMLQIELERRESKWQTISLIIAGICMQLIIAMFGFIVRDFYPIVTVVCVIYVLLSVSGSGIMAGVYVKREEGAVYGNR